MLAMAFISCRECACFERRGDENVNLRRALPDMSLSSLGYVVHTFVSAEQFLALKRPI
jgi:hypothetical protein